LQLRLGLDAASRFVAINDGNLDVHQNQVGPLPG
jgi:hypothetical protein